MGILFILILAGIYFWWKGVKRDQFETVHGSSEQLLAAEERDELEYVHGGPVEISPAEVLSCLFLFAFFCNSGNGGEANMLSRM